MTDQDIYWPNGEHDPRKHAETCSRMEPEDDMVIRAFCGTFVYNPRVPCSCGADTSEAVPFSQQVYRP